MSRRPRTVLLALALSLAAAAVATAAERPGPAALTLRLADVGPGYVLGDDPGCGVIAGEGAAPELTQIYLDHRHSGCTAELMELWTPAGAPLRPNLVQSAAFVFRDAAGPAAELQHARDVAAFVLGTAAASLTPLPAPAIGEEALAFATSDALVWGRPHRRGIVLAWRSGDVLALLLVAPATGAAGLQAATQLAVLQQERIATPTRLHRSDTEDLEVPLDNPHLAINVYWLGRRLDPPGPLPRLMLTDAFAAPRADSPDGQVGLRYGRRPLGGDIRIGIWPRRAWRRQARTRFGRLIWGEACTRSQRVKLANGHAMIYAGHEDPSACGAPADRFLAHVFLDGLVVSINPAVCFRCRDEAGPYDSRAGMRAVIRALRLRPPTPSARARPAPPAAASAPTAAPAASAGRA